MQNCILPSTGSVGEQTIIQEESEWRESQNSLNHDLTILGEVSDENRDVFNLKIVLQDD